MALPEVGLQAVIENLSGFERGAKSITKAMDNIDAKAESVTSRFATLGSTVLKFGGIAAGLGLAGVAAGLGTVAKVGLDFNNTLEKTTARINAFTKDGKKTAEIVENIRLEAAKTPFEFQEMASAVANLLPAAKSANVPMEKLLKQAEILAASNPTEGLEGAAFALKEALSGDFVSIVERFNLPRARINELKKEGVPALEAIQTAMEEMGLDIDLVTALAGTAEGRWSTFKDTLTNLAGLITQPIFDLFSSGLGKVNEFLAQNEPLLATFASNIASGIGQIIAKGQELFTAFQTGGAGGLLGALGLSPETIAKIGEAFEFINQHFEEFKGALIGLGAVLAGAAIVASIVAIGGAIATIVSPIGLVIAGAALLGAAWAGNWGGIQEKTFAVWAVVQPILTQLWTWLQVNLPPAIAFLGQAWENYLLPAISAVADFVANVWFPLQVEWWTWVGTTMVEAVTMLTNVWMTVLLPALTAIWQFVNTSLMPLWIAFVNLIKAVVMKTLDAWAGLWQNVLLPAIKSVYDFIIQNILPAFINLAGVIDENVIPSASKISEDIIPMLLSGFERIKTLLKDVAGLFDSWASSLRNIEMPKFLQEHSPSPFAQSLMHITEETIKASQALTELNRVSKLSFSRATIDSLLGVKRGVADTGEVIGAAADDVEKFLDKRMSGSKTNLTLTVLKRVFRGNADAILGATDREAKFKELLRGVNFERAGISGGDVKGAISQFLDSFDQIKAARQSLQQDIFIKAGRTAVTLGNQLNDIIKTSAEVLDTRVETLQKLVASGEKKVNFDGQIISATQAQKELNKALADQARVQQELVTLQQNEMRLNFLEKQLNLVETISKAGLNVKDVLGGLELGLNASIPDMIAATNKLVMAMINQVDEDLKISSPSKVMAEKGQMTGQGFVQGILAQIPDIAGVMKAAISGPLVNAPLAAGGGGGTVINNYSLGGNNINNGMDEATFEARVLGVIRRNLR